MAFKGTNSVPQFMTDLKGIILNLLVKDLEECYIITKKALKITREKIEK